MSFRFPNHFSINKSRVAAFAPPRPGNIPTINPAIPKYDGAHPYQQIPFQFSMHILKNDDSLIYVDYLHLEKSNPMPNLLKHLSVVADYKGSVISWNDTFEKGINKTMAEMYPDYKSLLDDINERMFDLSIIFKNDYLC